MVEERVDILIFGATGFTGKHCIPYLYKLSKVDGRNFTWGVAGRSEQKLEYILKEMGNKLGGDLSEIPIIIANIEDEDSLLEMAKRAKVVINCCGPFRFLGEPVVKACIAAGTHHIDVSIEPQYMAKMQLEQDQNAKEKGVYIISACGFGCLPNDLGVIFIQKNFHGALNSVETYLEGREEGRIFGTAINFGTWISGVYILAHLDELKYLDEKLSIKKLPNFYPTLWNKIPHKSGVVNKWVLYYPLPDLPIMARTQKHLYEKESKRPIRVSPYFVAQSILQLILAVILGLNLYFLSRLDYGRKLLLNYPKVFTAGMISRKQPSEESIEKSRFQITLYGQGWHGRLGDELQNYTVPCNRSIVGIIKGRNPGYGTTCVCLICAAIIVLTESNKMPGVGGVLSPGAAFANTSIIELLNENDVTFEIISQKST
ncbi:hypothetical protein JTB14_000459 [Gonioctena quinquepunctata]|nr:hypothetical protein JTB14_000459 [Gonioctena quinquepunctata]